MKALQNRLAIFLPSLQGGGVEKSMLKLAHGLTRRGYAVDLVVTRAQGPLLVDVPTSVRIVDLNAPRVLLSLPALVGYLRRERPLAMLANMDFVNVVALWARRLAGLPRKVAVYEHNTISMTARHSRQWRQRSMPRLVKHFYPWSDRVVCTSRGVAADLSKITGIPLAQLQVIYNPVVTPDLAEKANLCPGHSWLEAGQPPVVLAAGRLTAQKDFPGLIKAFARVRQTHAARLIIVGEGPDREALEALVRELNLEADVSLPGFVENPYAYMARASVFVLSSRWEGLPTVLIEALACGVPVVSTDCPSGPREILADGQHGALVPVQDVPALAEKIRLALNGSVPRPSKESWRPYEQETVVNQWVRVLYED